LFVNTNTKAGELRAELLDNDDHVIEPFSRENCNAVRADSTIQAVTWKGGKELARLRGKLGRVD
jgi:hypothetical protein